MTEFRTGNGADWLDLLATQVGRYRRRQLELLPDPTTLKAWLAEHGLEPVAAVKASDLQSARALRESLHRAAVATLSDQPPAPADVKLLRTALAADQPLRVRRTTSGLEVGRPADVAEALGRLARAAATDLTGPNRHRLHACDDDTCAGIFLDHSGRRRWCSDERCGVRARVRAHRARAQAGA